MMRNPVEYCPTEWTAARIVRSRQLPVDSACRTSDCPTRRSCQAWSRTHPAAPTTEVLPPGKQLLTAVPTRTPPPRRTNAYAHLRDAAPRTSNLDVTVEWRRLGLVIDAVIADRGCRARFPRRPLMQPVETRQESSRHAHSTRSSTDRNYRATIPFVRHSAVSSRTPASSCRGFTYASDPSAVPSQKASHSPHHHSIEPPDEYPRVNAAPSLGHWEKLHDLRVAIPARAVEESSITTVRLTNRHGPSGILRFSAACGRRP